MTRPKPSVRAQSIDSSHAVRTPNLAQGAGPVVVEAHAEVEVPRPAPTGAARATPSSAAGISSTPTSGPRRSAKAAADAAGAGGDLTYAQLDRMDTNEVWTLFRQNRSRVIRNYFWEKYYHLVKYIAERVRARLPDEVDLGDLLSAGQFGLMEAINAFKLEKNVKFETYCANRIKGAILDELRSMDWVPRLVRSRSNKVDGARQRFNMANGRMPTDEELAKKLGLSGEEFEKVIRDSKATGTVSLSRKCFQSDGNKDVLEIDVVEDQTQTNPVVESQRRDLKDLITKGLNRAERLIVVLYYYEEMTMKEIGATLDLSESRVSQMHSSILKRLKSQMLHREKEMSEED